LAKKAVQLAPKAGNYWNALGVALYRAGDLKAAIPALEKSIELQKASNPVNWLFLAMAQQKFGKYDEARESYNRAVQWLKQNSSTLEKHPRQAEELRRFQSEAEAVLKPTKK